jgi:hypothetical protein
MPSNRASAGAKNAALSNVAATGTGAEAQKSPSNGANVAGAKRAALSNVVALGQ